MSSLADKQTKTSKVKGYQHKNNAVCIVLYNQSGGPLSDLAQKEAEDAMLEVAMNHNLLLSITMT